jgi:hypothetical protein
MNSNNAVSATPQHQSKASQRITEYELAAAKLKLMGLTILALVCTVVVVVSPP